MENVQIAHLNNKPMNHINTASFLRQNKIFDINRKNLFVYWIYGKVIVKKSLATMNVFTTAQF